MSRRKLARIETNPYANELLNRGVEFMTESNETFNSVLEASVLHTGNVGSMLMDEVAHVNERVDVRREEIEALENWKEDMQGVIHGQEDSVVRQGADIDLLKVRKFGSGVIDLLTQTFFVGRVDHFEGLGSGSGYQDRRIGGR